MKPIKLWWYQLVNRQKQSGLFNHILFIILQFISFFYRLAITFRGWLYKSRLINPVKLTCPVISIGNITVGGTGKTPMTEYLARYFSKQVKKVVILSRGYGKISDKIDDEELSVSDSHSIRLSGPNRVKLGQMACEKYSPDVVLLDDGFQHRRLARNLDIVMIDCLDPFGNYHLFPAGILRESLNALKRADMFVLTHTDLAEETKLSQTNNYLARFGKPIIKSIHSRASLFSHPALRPKEPVSLETMSGKVWAFCGIGNPDSFRLTLQKSGVVLSGFTAFPDHYRYKMEDIRQISNQAKTTGAEYLVTTSKDITKILPEFLLARPDGRSGGSDIPLYTLKIELTITEGRERLEEMLKSTIP